MATSALNSREQSSVTEYGVFWQLWPQFEQMGGDRRMTGFEVELIGSHPSDVDHLNPACPMCRHVRSVLLEIADHMIQDVVLSQNSFRYIDSHSNSILCLPALGNRSAVSVSTYFFWNHANGQTRETDLLSGIKTFLATRSIHQR